MGWEVQEGGDIGITMADSCRYMAENHYIVKQLSSNENIFFIKAFSQQETDNKMKKAN